MASKDSSLGLKKIELADVPATAVIPASWGTELHDAVVGSATLSETEPSTTNIFTEQASAVYRNITTEDGVTTFSVELYDVSPDNLLALKGGSVDNATAQEGKRWNAPTETVNINKAVKLTTTDDYKVYIPNGKIVAVLNWPMTKGDLGRVSLTITAQAHYIASTGAAGLAPVIVEHPEKSA